ncbi:MAG: hypothetical protein L0Z53_02720 [Acidobacteriales bacterium]|nr:hypothetical protein [Terriglobales bacterium]
MNIDMTLSFLRAVLPDTGYINLVAIDPEKKAPTIAVPVDPEKLMDAVAFAERHNATHNIYWSPNPLRTALEKKAEKKDVLACQFLHIDLDDPSPEALERLRSFTPRPTIILFSGGGWQAFLALACARAGEW